MSRLAIKGHSTRGSEVIALIEMLGGKNVYNLSGDGSAGYYVIEEHNEIKMGVYIFGDEPYITFTLEDFEDKFPYKVGDKVIVAPYICTITDCWWDESVDEVAYCLKGADFQKTTYVKDLQLYKEQENMKKHRLQKEINGYLQNNCIKNAQDLIDIEEILNDDGIELPNNIVINRNGICSEEFIKWYTLLKYPKTYMECCEIVNASPYVKLVYDISDGQKYSYDIDNLNVYENIRRLKICRDAYWKIAGEPEPDKNVTFFITYYRYNGNFVLYKGGGIEPYNNILSFPTEEIRDVFYENFKDLIEQCKELL